MHARWIVNSMQVFTIVYWSNLAAAAATLFYSFAYLFIISLFSLEPKLHKDGNFESLVPRLFPGLN